MKYVFNSIFYSASAPKSAKEVIEYMKATVGSEMLTSYFPRFLGIIQGMVDKVNATKRVHIKMNYSCIQYDDGRRHGQISIFSDGKWGEKDIARLDYIEVDSMWAEDAAAGNELKQFTFNQWDKMKYRAEIEETVDEAEGLLKQMVNELREGRNVEEVVDKYVKCANSELREELISGIKNITQKGGAA